MKKLIAFVSLLFCLAVEDSTALAAQPTVRLDQTSFTTFQDDNGATLAQVDLWFSVTVPTGIGETFFSTRLRSQPSANPVTDHIIGISTWNLNSSSTVQPVLLSSTLTALGGVYSDVRGVYRIPESRSGSFLLSATFAAPAGTEGFARMDLSGFAWGPVPANITKQVTGAAIRDLHSDTFYLRGAVPEPNVLSLLGGGALVGLGLRRIKARSAKN